MHLLQSNSSRVHPGPELEDDDSDSIESLCKIPGEDKRCTLHFKGEITQKNDMEASSEEALGGIEQNATTALLRELIQYYGQGDKAIDAACRAALVSVIPQEMNSARDCDGNSLLITCCQLGGEGVSDLVERLLNKGADPNVVNSAGASALHFASYHGDSITTGLLLKCGGDPTQIECMHGCTPLHYAASVGNMEVCEALILAGADIFAEDHHSYTGSKYAEEAGHTLLRDMLNKEGCLARQRTNDCGIWRRHIDEATGAGYHYNSLTGECFWNEDVVRLARVEEVEIPEAIKSWIDQEKRRVTLTTLLAQVDPRRIIEVDEIMETDGSADKLDRLIQSLKEEYKFDKRKNNTSCDQPQMGTGSGDARNAIEKCVAMGKKEEAEKPDEELQVYDAQTLDAEAKEQEIQQEIDILKKNLNDLRSKSRSGTAEAEVIQRQLSEIRAGGGKRSDLEVDLSILKTSVDAENGRLEELRKALEIKESEDVGRKRKLLKEHKLDEKERQNRLRKIEADSAEEIRCIEAEHNERMRCAKLQSEKDLEKTKNEFDNRICMLKKEKSEFETEAEDKLHALVSTRDELVASAENDKLVAKKANAYLLETRVKIQDAHGIVRAFRTSLATLTRESECSAALHNQLVDMKGSSRLVVKLKPSSKSAAAFVKDGSTGIARVDNKPHRTFDFDAVATEQSELYTHIQPLAVSVADGRAVALVVFGTRGSGKTYSLFGGGETDSVFRKSPGVPEDPSCKAPSADTPGSPQKIKKSKQDDEDIYPIAGVIPRFLRTLFSTIEEREVRSTNRVSVAVAAVASAAAVEGREAEKKFIPLIRGQDNIEGDKSEVAGTNCWSNTLDLPVLDPQSGTETILQALATAPNDMHTAIKITCMNTRKEAPSIDPLLLEKDEGGRKVSGPYNRRRDSFLGMESCLGILLVLLLKDNSEKNKGGDTKGWTPVVGELLKKHACAGVGNSFETVEPVAEPLREVLSDEGAKTVALTCVDPDVEGIQADATVDMLENLTRCRPSGSDQEEALRCIQAQLKKIHLGREGGTWSGNSKPLKELPRPLAKSALS